MTRENVCGVYKITCLPNNKIYIGSSNNVSKRFSKHKYELDSKTHSNKYLQRAWHKYGKSSFVFELIEKCSREKQIIREQHWIDITNCTNIRIGYNICDIAGQPTQKYGENNSRATITKDVVIKIKIDLANGIKSKDLSEKYNVNQQLITNIKNLKSWIEVLSELNDRILSFVKKREFKNKSNCVKCNKVIYKKSNNHKYCKKCSGINRS